jgi:hypothetical protein
MKNHLILLYCITALGFLIGIHQGNIAIWLDDDPKPAKIFPYRAALLPEADRKLLEKGIRVDDAKQLTRYIEDLMS